MSSLLLFSKSMSIFFISNVSSSLLWQWVRSRWWANFLLLPGGSMIYTSYWV